MSFVYPFTANISLGKLKFAFLRQLAEDFLSSRRLWMFCAENFVEFVSVWAKPLAEAPLLLHAFYHPVVLPPLMTFLEGDPHQEDPHQRLAFEAGLLANLALALQQRYIFLRQGQSLAFELTLSAKQDFVIYDFQKNRYFDQVRKIKILADSFFLYNSAGKEIQTDESFSEVGYSLLAHEVALANFDLNPQRHIEYHPEKSGSELSWGGHEVGLWQQSYIKVLALLAEAEPNFLKELHFLRPVIVPVGFDSERHFSASYREAIGSVYLSLHPDLLVMLGAFIHEFQHNKIYLLNFFDDLLENAYDGLYRSPVRPDPRPLWGILLGAHAFVPVARIYRNLLSLPNPEIPGVPGIDKKKLAAEIARIDRKNQDGLQTLRQHGRFTETGMKIFQELEQMHLAMISEK